MAVSDVDALCTNIADTFRTVAGLQFVYDKDEIQDNIPPGDLPLLMVYPESTEFDVGSGTQMTTFGGGVNRPVTQEETIIRADVYIATVGGKPIKEVLQTTVTLWNALKTKITDQTVRPYFGDKQIKSFQASISRVTFEFSTYKFYGIQIDITTRLF